MCDQQRKPAVWVTMVIRESRSDNQQCEHLVCHSSVTQQSKYFYWHFLGHEVVSWRVVGQFVFTDGKRRSCCNRLLWSTWDIETANAGLLRKLDLDQQGIAKITMKCGLWFGVSGQWDRLLESAVLSCVLKPARDSPAEGASCETRGAAVEGLFTEVQL
jgi:hypothetical protein